MNGNFRVKHRACFTKKRKSNKLKRQDDRQRAHFRAERKRKRKEKRTQ